MGRKKERKVWWLTVLKGKQNRHRSLDKTFTKDAVSSTSCKTQRTFSQLHWGKTTPPQMILLLGMCASYKALFPAIKGSLFRCNHLGFQGKKTSSKALHFPFRPFSKSHWLKAIQGPYKSTPSHFFLIYACSHTQHSMLCVCNPRTLCRGFFRSC